MKSMLAALLALSAAAALPAPEDSKRIVARVLHINWDDDEEHVVAANWNGHPYLFVDYLKGEERRVVALEKIGGDYRLIAVTTGEEEGGTPDVAIGFANADRDAAKELIVLLSWPVQHYDVSGTLYEVRIFDDLNSKRPELAYLPLPSRHFAGHTCDCGWREGKVDHYKFKTIGTVKAELRRMGF